MDALAAVAIGVLSLIFLGSLLALILICRQRYCSKGDQDTKPILKYSRGEESGVAGNGKSSEEVDDVLQLSPAIEAYLAEEAWVYDASGLVEHCLAILRSAADVSRRLAAVPSDRPARPLLAEVQAYTRRVMPRIDDLVRTMGSTRGRAEASPSTVLPLAPLLEARAAALVLAISGLALAFKAAYPKAKAEAAWVKTQLADMELHLGALRLASQYVESSRGERVEIVGEGGGGSSEQRRGEEEMASSSRNSSILPSSSSTAPLLPSSSAGPSTVA